MALWCKNNENQSDLKSHTRVPLRSPGIVPVWQAGTTTLFVVPACQATKAGEPERRLEGQPFTKLGRKY